MQQRRHPPGEVLRSPYPAQAGLGVRVQQGLLPAGVPGGECLGEHGDVEGRQVQALGAGRRHDVGGVPRQVQPAVLHRLGHEAAHGRDALFDHRSGGQAPAGHGLQPGRQFGPDPVVGPVRDVLVRRHLQVKAAQGRAPHAVQGEAPGVAGVDQLL